MELIFKRLGEIHATLEKPSDHLRSELLSERDALLDEIAVFYWTATARQRGSIRRFAAGQHRLVRALEDRVAWHSYRIKTAEDIRHLRLGLSASSIVDGGVDPRDFGFNVQALFNASKLAGIDPRPDFEQAAYFSSKRRSFLLRWSLEK